MLRIRLLGRPGIDHPAGRAPELRGQKPWAVLARIVLSERPVARRQLALELFPEADDPLGALRWTLASVRKALGSPDVFVGDPVSNQLPEGATVDVHEVLAGRLQPPDSCGLLDGIDPAGGPEFDTWLLVTRQQIAARIADQLREQTLAALTRGDTGLAIELAKRGVRRDPFDEAAQVLLVRSLVMGGHPAAALQHVEEVEQLYARELGVAPTPALRSAARPSTAAPAPGVSPSAVASASLESGKAAIAAGAVDAGLDCLRRAVAQSEAAGDRALLARSLQELGSALVHSVRGFDDEGVVHLQQAAQLAAEIGDGDTLIPSVRELGYADAIAGRRPQAALHLARARELAGGDANQLAAIEAVAGLNESDWGHTSEALARFDAALEAARSSGHRRWEGWSLGIGGWAYLRQGDAGTAAAWAKGSLDIVEELRWMSFEPWSVGLLAEADSTAVRGDTRSVEHSFAVSCQLQDPCWEGSTGRVLALRHAATGHHEEAVRWIREARQRCIRRTDAWTGLLGSILLTEAEILGAAGDDGGRRAALRDLIALAARAHLDGHLTYAVAELDRELDR